MSVLEKPKVDDIDWNSLGCQCEACLSSVAVGIMVKEEVHPAKYIAQAVLDCGCIRNYRRCVICEWHSSHACTHFACGGSAHYEIIERL